MPATASLPPQIPPRRHLEEVLMVTRQNAMSQWLGQVKDCSFVHIHTVKEGFYEGHPASLLLLKVTLARKRLKKFAFEVLFRSRRDRKETVAETPDSADAARKDTSLQQKLLSTKSKMTLAWTEYIHRLSGGHNGHFGEEQPVVVAVGPSLVEGPSSKESRDSGLDIDLEPEISAGPATLKLGHIDKSTTNHSTEVPGATIAVLPKEWGFAVEVINGRIKPPRYPRSFLVGAVFQHSAPVDMVLRCPHPLSQSLRHVYTPSWTRLSDTTQGYPPQTCAGAGRSCRATCDDFSPAHMTQAVWESTLAVMDLDRWVTKRNRGKWVSSQHSRGLAPAAHQSSAFASPAPARASRMQEEVRSNRVSFAQQPTHHRY